MTASRLDHYEWRDLDSKSCNADVLPFGGTKSLISDTNMPHIFCHSVFFGVLGSKIPPEKDSFKIGTLGVELFMSRVGSSLILYIR